MAAVSELVDRLGVVGALDAAVEPIKQRDRRFSAGELLVGLASEQLAGRIFWSAWTVSVPMWRGRCSRRGRVWRGGSLIHSGRRWRLGWRG